MSETNRIVEHLVYRLQRAANRRRRMIEKKVTA
jgi:hypothetical protein